MTDGSLGEIEKLLFTLLTTGDNNERQRLDRLVHVQLDQNHNVFVPALVKLLRGSSQQPVRHMCAVLLRKKLCAGEPILYDRLPPQLQKVVQSELLQAVVSEPVAYLRRQICDTVSELAQVTLYRGQWPELLPFLQQLAGADKEELRATTYLIFSKVAENAPDQLEPHLQGVCAIYEAGLRDGTMTVRLAACTAVCAHVLQLEEDSHVAHFQNYIAPVMETLVALLGQNQLEEATRLIKCVVEVATHAALFFAPLIDQVSELFLSVGTNAQLEPGMRKLAMEFFTSTCVDRPGMCRRSQTVVQNACKLSLSLMLCVEDQAKWAEQDEPQNSDRYLTEDTLYHTGFIAMDRIAQAIGGPHVVPVVFPSIHEFVGKPEWQFRFVGLMALSQIGEVMQQQDVPVGDIGGFLGDSHPRVVYAALHCLGQLASDFAPDFQAMYHSMFMNGCMTVLGDARYPRLQTHAAAAMFNFIDGIEDSDHGHEIMHPYVDGLVKSLYELVKNGRRSVQEQCLTTLASISGAAPRHFLQYYPTVVPLIKQIISMSGAEDGGLFRARAMEAITYIGMKMGADVFRNDARDVMNIFMHIMQSQQIATDDISVQYMMQSWTRICSTLRQEFVPCLPMVMPHVLRTAMTKVDMQFLEVDDMDEDTYKLNNNAMYASLEEKGNGVMMLTSFLNDLGGAFIEYLMPTAQVLFKNMNFHLSDEVRGYCISGLPDLVRCAHEAEAAGRAPPDLMPQLFLKVAERVNECLKSEKDIELLMTLIVSFKSCIKFVGARAPSLLPVEGLQALAQALMILLGKSHERILEREQRKQSEPMDEVSLMDLEAFNQSEHELSFVASECIGTCIRTYRQHFVPIFNMLLQDLVRMLNPPSPPHVQTISLFIFDDMVEFAGPHATPFLQHFVPVMLDMVLSSNVELRQASAYGLGICAQHAPEGFRKYLPTAVERLVRATQDPAAKLDANLSATDNAVAALARIIQFNPDAIDQNKLIPLWLSFLPLAVDTQESETVYPLLCSLVQANNAALLGENQKNLPQVIAVLVHILGTPFCSQETSHRIAGILAAIKQMPASVHDALLQAMPSPQLQAKLTEAMANVNV